MKFVDIPTNAATVGIVAYSIGFSRMAAVILW